MLTKRLFALKLLFAVHFVMSLAPINCPAQDSTPDLADATLEQLGKVKVFSASKHLQQQEDAPSSVTIVTADEIAKHGYRTLADVLQTVRGFFVTYDRNYSSLGVRGFARPGDFNTRVLLLVDSHRLNDNIYDEAMLGTEFPIDIDLIERIEIIRGPVSSLYGSNALFAVINIITRHGASFNGLELAGEAGSFNTYEGRASYGKRVREFEYMISSTFYGSRGYDQLFFPAFNSPETNDGFARHADDDQFGSALATGSFKDFTLQAVYGTREKGIPTGAYDTLFNNSGTRTTDSHGYVDLRYEHTFVGSWAVVARAFYDRYNYEGTYIYSSTANPAEISPDFDFADGKWWGTELQVTKTVLSRNRVTAGGEYRDNFRQDQSNYQLSPYNLYLDVQRSSFVGAAYLQDELTINRKVSLNAGLRYDYYNCNDASTDPRVALIYRPSGETAFKFIYGEAFRVPNVYELYYSISPNLPNPNLKPERVRDAEVVWEQGLGKNLWFSTSAFYDWINSLITAEPIADQQMFDNLQNVKSTGLELELIGQFSRGLEAKASYSFQQTKDRDTGQFLSNSPRNLAKLSLTQPFLHRKVFGSLDAQYRSRIQSLDSGTVSPFMVVNTTLLGRNIGKHFDLSASLYNLLDKRYFDPPSTENLQMPIEQDGRSFRVKLSWHPGER